MKYRILEYMRRFFSSLSYNIAMFMQGRYGFDSLSKSMVICSLVLILIANLFRGLVVLAYIAWFMIIFAYFRALSRNFFRRRKELAVYDKLTAKTKKRLNLIKRMWKERKKYKYFKCKNCGAYWRVPRGIGVTEITCRICREKMTKKS